MIKEGAVMDDLDKGFYDALKYISKRMKTEAEVRRKLKSRYSEQAVRQIIDRLKERGYVDDAHYTECYIRDRMRLNPMGRDRIRMELERRGIEKDLIEQSSEYKGIDEMKVIEEMLESRFYQRDMRDEKERQRIVGYLYRRGFTFDNINHALGKRIKRYRR